MELVSCDIVEKFAIVTINRPPVNALDRNLYEELTSIFRQLGVTENVLAIILTGTGKAFSAGADIKSILGKSLEEKMAFIKVGNKLCNIIEALDTPVICAINGQALGGGLELAMACDIRIASEKAIVGLVETSIGIIPGSGGTQRLPRLIGKGKANLLLFTGKRITAKEALSIGLVEKVVVENKLLVEAQKIAMAITEKAPLAVRAIKKCVNDGTDISLLRALRIEAEYCKKLMESDDFSEGIRAFLEKRRPNFKGA